MHPLTNFDIDELLQQYPQYGGCFSKDLVNERNCKDGELYILNLDKVGNEGSHWTLLSLCNPEMNFYFDSFSAPPPESVVRFLKKQQKNALCQPLYENDQSLSSVSCGYFCVMFALLIIKRGFTPKQCIDFFDNDTKYNESIIEEFALDVLRKLKSYTYG
jgi:hypothetical protein